jgi:small-conductance mechanosensitive channel
MKKMKQKTVSLLIPVFALFYLWVSNTAVYSQAQRNEQDWRPEELRQLESDYQELSAQESALDDYAPDKFPDFRELEKTNQLVEMLDFNQRRFDLLIQHYNLVEDKLFPFLLKFSQLHPELDRGILATLTEYTGKGDKSLPALQKNINLVALQIERLKIQIERLQTSTRDKVLAAGEIQKSEVNKSILSISARLLQLEEDRKDYTAKLEEEKKKLAELEKKKEEASTKIEEKKKELVDLRQKAASRTNRIERVIHQTFAQVREIRLNGLEIPRLNTLKAFIYLANSMIDTLENQIQSANQEIQTLEAQQKKEIISQLFKGVIVIAVAIFMVFLLVGISRKVSKKIITKMEDSEKIDTHTKQRYQTLSAVILSFIKILVWILSVLWVLGELNIDYAPFLVAAGGISLAIGFGAQSLVKDMVSGFFMLMEEQYALGDVVAINGVTGTVEKISLRTIKFRSLDGTLHTIPNGSISQVSNQTHQWSRAIVKVGVSYDDDPNKVLSILNTVCREMAEDEQWKESLIDEPVPQGILSFGDSAVNFRILAKTQPGSQWAVEREIHIRVKQAFDQNDIEIPYNFVNIIDRTGKKEQEG